MSPLILLITLATLTLNIAHGTADEVSPPDVDLNEWWGPGNASCGEDTSIKPFKINFDQYMIDDLQQRLALCPRLQAPLEGIANQYGFNSDTAKSWVDYLANEYPFKKREKFLNQHPQFTTIIQGLRIHYIRVRPKVPRGVKIVPLLLLHGWPGSVREFYEVIPLLTAVSKDRDFALEVIIPNLPGYGFSDAAVRPGLGADKVAVVMYNLMRRLGCGKFYVHGGDWGSTIASIMVTLFPEMILGHHTTLSIFISIQQIISRVLISINPSLIDKRVVDRMTPLTDVALYLMEETGYGHLQATKPDTLGIALAGNPVGLLAYILEKFSTWTNKANREAIDGNLTAKFTREQLMDNIMIYWSSNCITTSMRLYSETFNIRYYSLRFDDIPSPVPTWLIQAKHEIVFTPPLLAKTKYPNLLGETILDDGGHFLSLEMPEAFAEDVLKSIGTFRKWHACKHAKAEL